MEETRPIENHSEIFYVGTSTNCKKLADSFFARYKESSPEKIIAQAVGASAVNQAVKAVIILNKKLAQSNEIKIAHMIPRFVQVENSHNEKVNVVECTLIFHSIY